MKKSLDKIKSNCLLVFLFLLFFVINSCGPEVVTIYDFTNEPEEPAEEEPPETPEFDYEIPSPIVEAHFRHDVDTQFASNRKFIFPSLILSTKELIEQNSYLKLNRPFETSEVINVDFNKMKMIENFFKNNPDGCLQIRTYDWSNMEKADLFLYSKRSCHIDSLVLSISIDHLRIDERGNIGSLSRESASGEDQIEGEQEVEEPVEEPAEEPHLEDTNMIPSAERVENCNACMDTRFQRTDLVSNFFTDAKEVHNGVYYRYQEFHYEDSIQPRVMNIHTLRIDLNNVDLVFREKPTRLKSTGNFMKDNGADIAVNSGAATLASRAGFFVTHTTVTISQGEHYSDDEITGWSLVMKAENEESLREQYIQGTLSREDYLKVPREVDMVHVDDTNFDGIFHALGGFHQLVWDNEIIIKNMFVYGENTQISSDARVTFGLDMVNNILIIIVVEGDDRKDRGMDLPELGCLNYCHGATRAINMDGGTSTTLVFKDPSSTSDNFVWDFKYSAKDPNNENPHELQEQRPAATHLGIRFK